MNINYFKRFKMEIDLLDAPPVPALPGGYSWVSWNDALLDLHAEVQYRSFREEFDTALFPSFGDRVGCQNLLRAVRLKSGFLPAATWLVAAAAGVCGTVQGVADLKRCGAIQNVGVVPDHRGLGLGGALLAKALHGFKQHGLKRAYLEVTAQNEGAIRLYQRMGFRRMKTLYKVVETSDEPGALWGQL